MSEEKNLPESVHPLGEEEFKFEFSPGGGTIHLRCCEDNLSPYGGLAAWEHFLERTGLFTQGWSCSRRVMVCRTLRPSAPQSQTEFWDTPEEDTDAFVTNLSVAEASASEGDSSIESGLIPRMCLMS